VHDQWAAPLLLVCCLAWLIRLLGPSALLGCGVMMLSIIVDRNVFTKANREYRKALNKESDKV
jgi:lipopolysaccharide export LptBFGC system permease protein LptF